MSWWMVLVLAAVLLALAELAARWYHRAHYLVPFHSKVIGEYPYQEFLRETHPPLFYRFKKNFHSKMVNLNRFGCRGPEPAPDGERKRLLLIGESYLFGVKLLKEEQVWSVRLQSMLDRKYPGRWEVINAGNPGYNSDQHLFLWHSELREIKPDILIVAMGGNDIAIAAMMGPKWKPGAPWPLSFIQALERKSPWWKPLLNRFCLYFLWRRMRQGPLHSGFEKGGHEVPRQACTENLRANYRTIVEDARAMGVKVMGTFYAPAVDYDLDERGKKQVESIQANWRQTLGSRTSYDLALMKVIREEVCPALDMPFIDLYRVFKNHPQRFEMYFDLAHWNARGMLVTAGTFFSQIEALGWWDESGSGSKAGEQ